MKLKINNVPGYSGTVTIKTDPNGVPLERFWRNRLRDAKTDNCIELVTYEPKPAKKEKAK